MQTSVSANKSQEIQPGGGETESGFIPKLHRSSWEENLPWNSHSICNLATVPRLGHLGVGGRMFSLTCSWLRISLPNVLLQLKCVNSVGSQEDSVTWSSGEGEDGRNHWFAAELSLFISSFLTNLHGGSLSLASLPGKRRTWAAISSALVCYYGFPTKPCAGASSALTLGLLSATALSTCMWVNASWRAFRMSTRDDGGGSLFSALAPRQPAWFRRHPLMQARQHRLLHSCGAQRRAC